MRRVRLGMRLSLDGYVVGPHGEMDWIFRTMSPDQQEWVIEFLRGVDTILIGRATYLEQAAVWPMQSDELATLLNSHAKIVFSSVLETVEWNNSRLATADPATEIAQLKRQSGKDIYVTGGASFVQSLSRLDLIDEYNLAIHPVVLGGGKPIFKDLAEPLNLKLVNARTFDAGTVQLTYEPATSTQEENVSR